METDMKNMMKKIALGIALLVLPALADTPFQQALELQQDIQNVMEAFHDANADIQSLAEAPSKIRSITRIADMIEGRYQCPPPIVINSSSFSNTGFKNLAGTFDVYMPNLTTVATELFYPAPGLRSFYGPKVTSVNNSSAFRDSTNLGIVDLPECAWLGNSAFNGCTSLTNINIPKVTSTGTYVFNGCSKLKSVNCQPLATVNEYAFSGCTSLTNVPLRKSSVTFSTRCFNGCTSLDIKEDEWPDAISLSGGCQFYNCKGLKNINPFLEKFTVFSATDTTDQGRYFQGCSSLVDVHSDNLVTLGCHGLFADCISVTNVDFPNAVQIGNGTSSTTGGYVFHGMTSLKRINLPKLQGIIPTCVDYMAWNTFAYCTSLEEIELPSLRLIGNPNKNVSYQAGQVGNLFYNCNKLRSARFPVLEQISTYGTSAEHGTFYNCYELVDVQMPSLRLLKKQYEYNANYNCPFFNHCLKLSYVNFPSLKEIHYWTARLFVDCPSLRKVDMPNLTFMNNYCANNGNQNPGMADMFYQCPFVTDVTFGLTGAALKAYPGFPGGAPTTCVFHCPADAPYNVDVMYLTNAWTVVTNGTFKLIDSIKGTGTQYINTGYTHNTNTLVEIDFAIAPSDSPRTSEYIFGARANDNNVNSFAAESRNNNIYRFMWMRNQFVTGSNIDLTQETRYKMVCCTNKMEVYNANEELLYMLQTTSQPNEGVGPMMIFTANNSTTKGGVSANSLVNMNMKLYRFIVKEENETVMDLVPALVGGTNTEQVACLVDLKNNFHPLFNIGTGSFEAGSVTNDIATAYGLQE